MTEPDHHPTNVAPILKSLGVLKKDSDDAVPLDRSVGEALLDAVRDAEKVADCVAQLFPDGIPVDQTFFDQLDEFHRWIGVGDSGDEALGLIWAEAMSRLNPSQEQELLNVFSQQEGHEFFENVRSLQVITRERSFPATFLESWLVALLRAVERDMAQGSVWQAIRAVCMFHVDTALETLDAYLREPDQHRRKVAGFMLGVLRLAPLDEKQASRFTRIENGFRNNGDQKLRAVFNWSCLTTAGDREISQDELSLLTSRSETSPEDLNNVVCVISRLIIGDCLPHALQLKCMRWISDAVGPTLFPEAKYHLVWILTHLQLKDSETAPTEGHWIMDIQPVSEDEAGTWEKIGDFLCDVLKRDVVEFTTLFFELCATSASTIHRLMLKDGMQGFLHELGKADVSSVIAKLALSVDTATRKFGLYLLDELGVKELPQSVIESVDSISLKLLFYEAQRTMLNPTTIARVLAALVPSGDESDDFQEAFFDELKLQCHNFSGGCRRELERLAKEKPLVAEALTQVSTYFNSLKKAHAAGINAMDVAGARKAAREQRRRFNKQVSESAKSASPLLSMMKHVTQIYGKSHSQYINGTLSGSTPLSHVSHSMEMPLVDFFDPEEMALRRLHASTMISRMLQGQHEEGEKSDE